MKYGRKHGLFAAVAMIAVLAGVAASGVAPVPAINGASGWWLNFLVPTSGSTDSGLVYSAFQSQTDSKVYGVAFVGPFTAGNGSGNVAVASYGTGSVVSVSGSHSLSAGTTTRYLQRTDTARITVTTSSYADSITGTRAATSWSSAWTGASGTATDSFLYENAGGTIGNFASSRVVWDTTNASLAILQNTDSLVLAAPAAQTFRILVDTANANDTVRFVVVRPSGKVHDTQGVRTADATSETFAMPGTYLLESGMNTVYAFYWNANEGRIRVHSGDIAVGLSSTTLTNGSGGASASNVTSAISQVAVIANSNGIYPQVSQVLIGGVAGAPGPRDASDLFLTVDSNTSGFDTRMPNSVFEIIVRDTAGNYITQLPSGTTFLVTVAYNFSGLSASAASSLKLMRLNEATNAWEVVSNSSSDSANSRVVGYLSHFSKYAIGNVNTAAAVRAADDDDCAITMVAGKTGLQGILPSFRSVRDTLLGSALGRLFVSGYYAFGMLMLAAAGFGVALASRR